MAINRRARGGFPTHYGTVDPPFQPVGARRLGLNDDLIAHYAAFFDDERDAAAIERVVGDSE